MNQPVTEAVADRNKPVADTTATAAIVQLFPQAAPAEANPAEPDTDENLTFTHGGKTYHLFKRTPGAANPYYIRFEHNKKPHWKCLETNVKTVAIKNAKIYIARVKAEKWVDVDKLKARQTVATVGAVKKLYAGLALIGQNSIDNNMWALGKILKTVLGVSDPDTVSLNEVTRSLADSYQTAMVKRYEAEVLADGHQSADHLREAREKAMASSRSIILQARSLFNQDKNLVEKYEKAGLKIPTGIWGEPGKRNGFMNCKLLGSSRKREYLAPPDSTAEKAFTEIEKVKDADPNVYKGFWMATGAGLRRAEMFRCRWEFFIERDGNVWISGGMGKDGEKVEVPVQARAWAALKPFRKTSGPVIEGEALDEWAKRLNFWIKLQGWNTEKKMHELRAYVGSLIYKQNPQAAMRFMRHKTIKMTEQFYVRYGKDAAVPEVL